MVISSVWILAMTTGMVGLGVPNSEEFPIGTLKLTSILDGAGKSITIDPKEAKATVLLFISTECPIANRYAPEINRITKKYVPKGVNFRRVYVVDRSAVKDVQTHGKEFGFTVPAILDPKRSLVKELGMKVTPEAAVISAKGLLLYRGRIDAQNIQHGKIRKDYRHDLRIALDEILGGKPVSVKETSAIGCFL